VENSLICICGHVEEDHGLGSCWGCFSLNLKDNCNNISVRDRHPICSKFKLDNLSYLEQQYERLSKRIF
jgi:hypothetical protein